MRIEHHDDLYHLFQLIDTGDRATSLTERREEEQGDRLRPDKSEKRKMVLTLEVIKAEFAPFTDRLRVLGLIEDTARYGSTSVRRNPRPWSSSAQPPSSKRP